MGLSTKNQATLALFSALIVSAVFQNIFTCLALATCAAVFAFVLHVEHAQRAMDEDLRRQFDDLKARVNTMLLGQGMRR